MGRAGRLVLPTMLMKMATLRGNARWCCIPITSARDEQSVTDANTYLTQWFERERLEYHPGNRGTPYEVLLGLLGAEELRVRGYLP